MSFRISERTTTPFETKTERNITKVPSNVAPRETAATVGAPLPAPQERNRAPESGRDARRNADPARYHSNAHHHLPVPTAAAVACRVRLTSERREAHVAFQIVNV